MIQAGLLLNEMTRYSNEIKEYKHKLKHYIREGFEEPEFTKINKLIEGIGFELKAF